MPSVAILGYPLHGKDVFLRSLLLTLTNLHKIAPGARCDPRDRETADRIKDMLDSFRRGDLPQASPVAPAHPLQLSLTGFPGFAPVDLDLYVLNGEPLYEPELTHLLAPVARADALWILVSLADLVEEGLTLADLYAAVRSICKRYRGTLSGLPITLILSKADRLLDSQFNLPTVLTEYLFHDHLRDIDRVSARHLPLFGPTTTMRELRAMHKALETYTLNVPPGGAHLIHQADSDGCILDLALTATIFARSGPLPLRAFDPLLLTLYRWAKAAVLPRVIVPPQIVVPELTPDSVFISYKRIDWDEFVRPLVSRLRQHGIPFWVDQYLIENSQEWWDAINHALKICQRMILCISPEALQSDYVKTEYRYFINNAHLDKKLYLLMCREAELPAELQVRQYSSYDRLPQLIHLLKRPTASVR